jgi:TolA-binding protein
MMSGSPRGQHSAPSAGSSAHGSAHSSKHSSNRFTDTTVVNLAEAKPSTISQILRQAQAYMDEQRYEAAMEHIRIVMETVDQRDSLAQEAQFMLGELYVQQNEFDDAFKAFSTSVQSPLTVPGVREKSLLRLGHVYCAKGKNEEAAKVFKRFKEEFPGSSYVQLASCSSVGR